MLRFKDKEIVTDKDGYLMHFNDWSKALAETIASQELISLSEEHWQVIYLIRQFYQQYNTSPAIRMLVTIMKKEYGEEKGNSRYLYQLFPAGPAKQATKIAGLPKPVKCI